MRESVKIWENLGCSTDAFFASPCPNQDTDVGTLNPNESNA